MKTFFNEKEKYTEEALELRKKIHHSIKPLFTEIQKMDYSLTEIAFTFINEIMCIFSEKQLQKDIECARKDLKKKLTTKVNDISEK
jgi:hypothetical protein